MKIFFALVGVGILIRLLLSSDTGSNLIAIAVLAPIGIFYAVQAQKKRVEISKQEDDDRPVEEISGFLGFDCGGMRSFAAELSLIEQFDWENYERMASELDQLERSISIKLIFGSKKVRANAGDVGAFLGCLPSIDVIKHNSKDLGPGGDSGVVFVLSDQHDKQFSLSSQINGLRNALEEDYEGLRLVFISDPEIQKSYALSGESLPESRNYIPVK